MTDSASHDSIQVARSNAAVGEKQYIFDAEHLRARPPAHDRRSFGDLMSNVVRLGGCRAAACLEGIDEDKMAGALLRAVIGRSDVVMADEMAVVIRVVLPLRIMEYLEAWGAAGEDDEAGE